MIRAAGIEAAFAFWACRIATEIIVYRNLAAARAAHDCRLISFIGRPNLRLMIRNGSVALETRKPAAATFEFDGDNIRFAMPMRAACLGINPDTVYFLVMNQPHHTFSLYKCDARESKPADGLGWLDGFDTILL